MWLGWGYFGGILPLDKITNIRIIQVKETNEMTKQTPAQIVAKAYRMTSARSIEQLVEDFEESERVQVVTMSMAIVRCWIMDELEMRNPDAFDAWMESNERSPRNFFLN
jgi:hypothetical protein